MGFKEELEKKSNKELGEIIFDFTKCGDCMNCKAEGILCGFSDPNWVRFKFMEVVAERLTKGE